MVFENYFELLKVFKQISKTEKEVSSNSNSYKRQDKDSINEKLAKIKKYKIDFESHVKNEDSSFKKKILHVFPNIIERFKSFIFDLKQKESSIDKDVSQFINKL